MSDIAKGILGGGWGLLVGWILPTLINVTLFVAVAPALTPVDIGDLLSGANTAAVVAVVSGVLVAGLVLAAVQNFLYRVLEGYTLWPWALQRWARQRQLARKRLLTDRLTALRLAEAEARGEDVATAIAPYRAHRRLAAYTRRGEGSAVVTGLVAEQLRRYPLDDAQIAPTRLGNSIRRLEEYAWSRFGLDSQILWSELGCVADEQARKEETAARTNVDFFVCLLSGHVLLAVVLVVLRSSGTVTGQGPVIAAVVLLVLARVWYSAAVRAVDGWDGAVRSIVNLGRVRLAEHLGLVMPDNLADERLMWLAVARLVRDPADPRAAVSLDAYRKPATPALQHAG
ncbi:hypothetical protein [Catellatospora chokoriensis]|uniref:Uncharacterized protein n=1 Tax=Catellatospora chokoriensis TaxID=310353 RepID=A0A8J3K8L8_9ACTN|nr:hypothetical protein [Catellatospora chokoriensis]GIF90519.1 hypothetical protein Cch02nite_39630 [Catellatospora chokoriensis]